MKLIFVYGSLLSGMGNHGVIEGAHFVAHHVTDPEYSLMSLGAFPGLILEGDTAIHGELYNVDDATYERVEHLEGYPTFYQRTSIRTPHGEADTYYLDRDNYSYSLVESGDWKAYKNQELRRA